MSVVVAIWEDVPFVPALVWEGDDGLSTEALAERIKANSIAVIMGPQGTAGTAYTHTQTNASSSWVINHNLGYKPNTQVLNLAGQEVGCDIQHLSNNVLQVTFVLSVAGTARLN